MKKDSQTLRIASAVVLILGTIVYLAISGVQSNKSYYVTVGELQAMGSKASPTTQLQQRPACTGGHFTEP